MNLILDERFRISSDKHNLVLEKYEDVKDRETGQINQKWKDVGYYGTIEHVLNKYKNERIRDSEASSIEDLVVELKEMKLHISDVVKKENITLKDFQHDPV